ncbi:hypothetical protein V8B97DRAFT_2045253 [Scleroderma yunnanense]
MILAQLPVSLTMSPSISHRRHPSAPPAVVVQPTKVPGLLSIAKPIRPSSRQQHSQSNPRQHRTPKPKLPAGKTQPPSAEATSKSLLHLKQASATVEKKTPHLTTPPVDKSTRGRQSSTPSVHGRRNNVRQPSPPLSSSSQAEATPFISSQSFAYHSKNPASNSFDPFLVSSDSDSENPRPPILSRPSNDGSTKVPSLATLPSGKLARRRGHTTNPPSTPTPSSKAVPVPRTNTQHRRQNLSRSAPSNSSAQSHQNRRSSAGFSAEFPICDDTTDVEEYSSPPSTPTRESSWKPFGLDGPRTAPLSARQEFPFSRGAGATPSPISRHRRTPSEGVFNLSFDEDMSHSDASDEFGKLRGFPQKRFSSVGPSLTGSKDKSGFFASSVFQNSPSPDELPPPAF